MFYGYHSTAKSTAYYHVVANYQVKYSSDNAVWIDAEGLFDRDWARKIGIDLGRLVLGSPDNGEDAVDMVEKAIKCKTTGLVILDSIPACVPFKVVENSAGDDTMGALARLMGKMCSKVTCAINEERSEGHRVTFGMVNQIREKVGVMFGSPLTRPGGKQINHLPATVLWLKLVKQHVIKDKYDNECPDYNEQSFHVEKSKVGSSLKDGNFNLNFNTEHSFGVPEGHYDNVPTLRAFAVKMGFITGSGGNYQLASIAEHHQGTKFKTYKDIEAYLYANQEEQDTLARSMIVMQRVAKNLSPLPPDGYLVSPHGRLVTLE